MYNNEYLFSTTLEMATGNLVTLAHVLPNLGSDAHTCGLSSYYLFITLFSFYF